MKRILWIDAARGMGIIAVVGGHTIVGRPQDVLYWFHMPLFFLISGYVYRTSGTAAEYAGRRTRQLLVPYASWLLILSAPGLIKAVRAHEAAAEIRTVLWGGANLAGPTGTLWFLTALFGALAAYDFLRRYADRWVAVAALLSYLLAVARALLAPKLLLPFSLEAALVALPFIHVGAVAREKGWALRRIGLAGAVCFFTLFLAASALWQWPPVFDLKLGHLGIPVVSFLVSLSGAAGVSLLAQYSGPLTAALAYVGRASLLVMVVHPWILSQFARLAVGQESLRFSVALAVPLLMYPVFRRFALTRTVLLGEAES